MYCNVHLEVEDGEVDGNKERVPQYAAVPARHFHALDDLCLERVHHLLVCQVEAGLYVLERAACLPSQDGLALQLLLVAVERVLPLGGASR